jgi:two-component system, OmpR family, response regulator MprA
MKKVLVVDDEYTIRELVGLSLEPDYEVLKAEDGTKGLELAKTVPDLIIIDIMMPVVDGYEFCRRVRSNDTTKDIPIIMLTAKHQPDDVRKAVSVDVDEYLTKPFEPDMLKRRVDAYLKGGDTKRRLVQYGKSLHYVKGREFT